MLKRFFKEEIHYLYLNNFLRGLAFSLFGIFVPIYLLTLGYSLTSVLTYFLVFQTTMFIFSLFAYTLSRKIGYKRTILTSTFFLILFVLLLQLLETKNISIYIIAIIAGIQNALYYLPMHGFFTKLSKKNSKGTQFSNYTAFGQGASLLGPLIGARIATLFGFKYLFYIVFIFILISIIPLLSIKNITPKNKASIKKFFIFTKNNKGYFLGTILDNIKGEVDIIIWPIFVYLTLKNIISVGEIAFLLTLGTIIFTLFVGRYYDKKGKYFMLRLGGILFAVIWFTRAFYDSSLFIFISSLLAGFVSLMIAVSFESIFYEKASKEKDQNAFIIYREVPTFIGRAIIWITVILVVNKFTIGFIITGIATLIFSFLKFGIKDKK